MPTKNILEMDRQQILSLGPNDFRGVMSPEEFFHIAKVFLALWNYDYESKKPGLHIRLKSGHHSDAAFNSAMLLAHENICTIMAMQMITCLKDVGVEIRALPTHFAGVPNGATKLASRMARILGLGEVVLEKCEGSMRVVSPISITNKIMLVDDVYSQGTGFLQATEAIKKIQPHVCIRIYHPVMLNRGKWKHVEAKVKSLGMVVSIVEKEFTSWEPEECPLCDRDSVAVGKEDWHNLIISQL